MNKVFQLNSESISGDCNAQYIIFGVGSITKSSHNTVKCTKFVESHIMKVERPYLIPYVKGMDFYLLFVYCSRGFPHSGAI